MDDQENYTENNAEIELNHTEDADPAQTTPVDILEVSEDGHPEMHDEEQVEQPGEYQGAEEQQQDANNFQEEEYYPDQQHDEYQGEHEHEHEDEYHDEHPTEQSFDASQDYSANLLAENFKKSATIRKIKKGPTTPGAKTPESSPTRRATISGPPSDRLMRSTRARLEDSRSLVEKQKQKEEAQRTPSPKKPSSYKPSERLLKTTQARISDIREWEHQIERSKYDDDIWWEQRRPAARANAKIEVGSKLFEHTRASVAGKRDKFTPKKEENTPNGKETIKIDPANHLLTKTVATTQHSWQPEATPPKPIKLDLPSQATGPPNVNSKLFEKTAATSNAEWKKADGESGAEETKREASPAKLVRSPSDRLLAFNSAMKAYSRPKAKKRNSDPREEGWNLHVTKEKIPPVEAVFGAHNHQHHSTRLSNSQSRSTGSGQNFDENYEEEYEEEEVEQYQDDEEAARQRKESQESVEEVLNDDPAFDYHHEVTNLAEAATTEVTQA